MGWKKWSDWLKSGLIFGLIGALLFFVRYATCRLYNQNLGPSSLPFYCSTLSNITTFINFEFDGLRSVFLNYYAPFVSCLITFLYYFIIGAIIGLIYAKIKGK